jgi:hypothetical protein
MIVVLGILYPDRFIISSMSPQLKLYFKYHLTVGKTLLDSYVSIRMNPLVSCMCSILWLHYHLRYHELELCTTTKCRY